MIRRAKLLLRILFQELWLWFKGFFQLKHDILSYSKYLENGKYEMIFASPTLIVMKLEGSACLPNTLQTTISELWHKPNKRSGLGLMVRDSIAKLREAILFVCKPLIKDYYSMTVLEESNQLIKLASAQVILIRSNGKVLLFDLDKKLLYTKFSHYKNSHYSSFIQSSRMWGYEMMKKEIANYLTLPDEKNTTGCFFCQDIVDGEAYSSLQKTERLNVIKHLSLGSIKMSEYLKISPTVNSFDILQEGFNLALSNVKHNEILLYIKSRKGKILEYAKDWRMIPSHCDLTAHNITIVNNRPVLLDLAPHKVGFAPEFLMATCLIHSEAREYSRYDMLNSFLNGELDEEFNRMHGVSIDTEDRHSRTDLLLAETLVLVAIDSKINPQQIEYWFEPIFELIG